MKVKQQKSIVDEQGEDSFISSEGEEEKKDEEFFNAEINKKKTLNDKQQSMKQPVNEQVDLKLQKIEALHSESNL